MKMPATASKIFTRSNTVCHTVPDLDTPLTLSTAKQTVEFNIKARVEFKTKIRARMSVWQAMEMLDTLVDESDPDVSA
jgi:hypothetical protein